MAEPAGREATTRDACPNSLSHSGAYKVPADVWEALLQCIAPAAHQDPEVVLLACGTMQAVLACDALLDNRSQLSQISLADFSRYVA